MPPPKFPALQSQYEDLYASMAIRPERKAMAEQLAQKIAGKQNIYREIMQAVNVPWEFIGVTHMLEASQNFTKHLHNGDPLTAKTVQVPAGRPSGNPPFTFVESAIDALRLKGLDQPREWSVARFLFEFERYNGFGYRYRGLRTPYLWSFSNHYTAGKFVKDGVYSPTAVSQQAGAAVLLSLLRGGDPVAPVVVDSPLPAKVKLGGKVLEALLFKNEIWIGAKLATTAVAGLEVVAFLQDPQRVVFGYKDDTHEVPARIFGQSGHVRARALCEDVLKRAFSFDTVSNTLTVH